MSLSTIEGVGVVGVADDAHKLLARRARVAEENAADLVIRLRNEKEVNQALTERVEDLENKCLSAGQRIDALRETIRDNAADRIEEAVADQEHEDEEEAETADPTDSLADQDRLAEENLLTTTFDELSAAYGYIAALRGANTSLRLRLARKS